MTGEKKIVLCIGADRSHWRIRKLVVEMTGAKAILAEGYKEVSLWAANQQFHAAIIGNDFSSEEAAQIRSTIVTLQKGVPILDLPPFAHPRLLAAFVASLSK